MRIIANEMRRGFSVNRVFDAQYRKFVEIYVYVLGGATCATLASLTTPRP